MVNNFIKKPGVSAQVNINDLDDIECSNVIDGIPCRNRLFVQCVILKHISALQSPNRQEGQVMGTAGYLCSACGAHNMLKRVSKDQANDDFEIVQGRDG